jgi:hypothetical protein
MAQARFGETTASEPVRVLILGRTYMHYSMHHMELECTGGLLADSFRMVRLHPIPYRYLERDNQFHDFQWITVNAQADVQDSRPETLRVDPHSITLEAHIPSENIRDRRRCIDASPHRVASVEELLRRQSETVPPRVSWTAIRV